MEALLAFCINVSEQYGYAQRMFHGWNESAPAIVQADGESTVWARRLRELVEERDGVILLQDAYARVETFNGEDLLAAYEDCRAKLGAS